MSFCGVVLAGDIGGTNAKLALARAAAPVPQVIKRAVYRSGEYAALERVVQTFLADGQVALHAGSIAAACFAVAGPVEAGRARLTNLGWQIDEVGLST